MSSRRAIPRDLRARIMWSSTIYEELDRRQNQNLLRSDGNSTYRNRTDLNSLAEVCSPSTSAWPLVLLYILCSFKPLVNLAGNSGWHGARSRILVQRQIDNWTHNNVVVDGRFFNPRSKLKSWWCTKRSDVKYTCTVASLRLTTALYYNGRSQLLEVYFLLLTGRHFTVTVRD